MNVPTVTNNGLSFINLNKPTAEQINFLNKNFGFSMLHLEDYLYKTQIPKIEVDGALGTTSRAPLLLQSTSVALLR